MRLPPQSAAWVARHRDRSEDRKIDRCPDHRSGSDEAGSGDRLVQEVSPWRGDGEVRHGTCDGPAEIGGSRSPYPRTLLSSPTMRASSPSNIMTASNRATPAEAA